MMNKLQEFTTQAKKTHVEKIEGGQARSLLFDVQHLVKKTVKFVPAFFKILNKPTEEVLRDNARVVFIPIFHCYCHGIWETLFFVAVSTGKRISYSRIPITRTPC